jgi:hypothetical protein
MTAAYRVERLTGAVSVRFRGHSDPARCDPLDACGLDGRLDLMPRATHGSAYISATGPASLPRSRFRAALGLETGPGGGIRVYGGADWSGLGRAVQTQSWQAGGVCGSAMPFRSGALQIRVAQGRAIFDYTMGDYGPEPLRGRCPGPLPSEVGRLLSGSVALRALGARRIIVRMRRGSSFSGEAHRGSTSGHIDMILRRVALRETTYQTFAPN